MLRYWFIYLQDEITKMPRLKKAFSLLEVMISLIVFGIGILYLLKILWIDLSMANKVWIRNVSVYLAQENMELLFVHRNQNFGKWLAWNCLDDECDARFVSSENNPTDFDVPQLVSFYLLNTGYQSVWDDDWNDKFQIWLSWWMWTKTNKKVKGVLFQRALSFSGFWSQADGVEVSKDKIVNVFSKVRRAKWASSWEIMLQSFISNWRY